MSELRSFSSAARALGTVQSNVSAHVSRLENELGVTLIDRSNNAPTPEGQAVLERARRIEGEFSALESDLAFLRDEVTGSVTLGLIGTTARWLAPPLLRWVWDSYPEIRVVLLDAPSTALVLGTTTGSVDLAVINLPVNDPDVVVEPLFSEDRVVIAPEGHPLYDCETVDLQELAQHELLLEAQGTAFRDVIDSTAAESGLELRARAEFDGMRLLASLAFEGFGAGLVAASAIPPGMDGPWRAVPVTDLPSRSVGLMRRSRSLPSAAVRVLADGIVDVVQREGPSVPGIRPSDDIAGHRG